MTTITNRTKASALLGLGVAAVLAASGVAYATTGYENAAGPTKASAAAPYGTAHLLQSDDFFQTGIEVRGARVDTRGRFGLSACTGEETMAKLTRHNAAFGRYAEISWDGAGQTAVVESIAQAPDVRHARIWTRRLKGAVAGCRHEPAGHWHYGPAHALTTKDGQATWRLSRSGDGVADGGVTVLRSGLAVGIVELAGDSDGAVRPVVKDLTRASLHRLR